MALINLLATGASERSPSFFDCLFILTVALPAYHLVIVPIYNSINSRLSTLPGPKLTLLTPLYITALDALLLRSKTLHKWHQRYGPVVRVGPNEVSFISPTAVKQIYQDPTMEKDTRLYGQFTHFGANNAFSSRTRYEHGWRRKGVAALLSWSKILESEVADRWIGQVIGRYLKAIHDSALYKSRLISQDGMKLVDVYGLNSLFATDVVSGFIFGPVWGTKTLCFEDIKNEAGNMWWQKPSYHRRMVKEHYSSSLRAQTYLYVEFPRTMHLVLAIVRIFKSCRRNILAFAGFGEGTAKREKEIICETVEVWGWKVWTEVLNGKKGHQTGKYVAEVLASYVNGEGNTRPQSDEQWTSEIAASELMDQILAGMDTTSDTLSFLMYHLSLPSSQHIQQRLHLELITAFPPSSPHTSVPTFFIHGQNNLTSDSNSKYMEFIIKLNALPYLDAVIKETLRVYPAIPVTLPRVVPDISGQGKVIDGYYMPPGTVVGAFAYGIHRDKSVFGEDAYEPENWITDSQNYEKASRMEKHWLGIQKETENPGKCEGRKEDIKIHQVKGMEKRLWAFGSGGRICVGRHLAMLEMKMLVAAVFWNYKTQVVDDLTAASCVKLDHSYWNERKTFRDVLPFKGVNGLVSFLPRKYGSEVAGPEASS
ncbi:cytochrome P450 [Kalaharituber pfeilii]|nr:cytochrome P450 [Kalaharituber pfeilii]